MSINAGSIIDAYKKLCKIEQVWCALRKKGRTCTIHGYKIVASNKSKKRFEATFRATYWLHFKLQKRITTFFFHNS